MIPTWLHFFIMMPVYVFQQLTTKLSSSGLVVLLILVLSYFILRLFTKPYPRVNVK